jgi:mitochondrial FAD-linked sulfhydryl oxidase
LIEIEMPVTGVEYPILARFLCAVEKSTNMPAQPLLAREQDANSDHADAATPKQLPKGVVLGPDGKP